MSTPDEIISDVMGFSTRVDLEDRLLAYFKTALYSAHKIDRFARDLVTVDLVDAVTLDGKTQISLTTQLPRLREVRGLQFYKSYVTNLDLSVTPAEEITLPYGYRNTADMLTDRNYFGFKYSQTYSILGDTLTINGVDSQQKVIRLTGLFLPTWELNRRTGKWQSDSWILRDSPEIVEAYLRIRMAELGDDDKKLRQAQGDMMQKRRDLLATYVTELLGDVNHGN